MTARYEEQHAIVARIWIMLRSPTYEELGGRSIFDLIGQLIAIEDAAALTPTGDKEGV